MIDRAAPWTLVIADDHPMVLRGISDLLDEPIEFSVVESCPTGRMALEAVRKHRPTLALLDVNMPDMTGLEVLQSITRERLRTRVVFLTATLEDDQLFDAVAAGLCGLLLKEEAPETLIQVLKRVASGGRWLPEALIAPVLEREAMRRDEGIKLFADLTPREIQIAKNVSEGFSNKEIARSLGLTEGTVKVHLHNIYEKLGVANRTALAGCFLSRKKSR